MCRLISILFYPSGDPPDRPYQTNSNEMDTLPLIRPRMKMTGVVVDLGEIWRSAGKQSYGNDFDMRGGVARR